MTTPSCFRGFSPSRCPQNQINSSVRRGIERPYALEVPGLLVEQTRLHRGGNCSGLAPRYPDDTQHDDFTQGAARYKDAVGVRIQIRRGDLDPIIQQVQQVVGDDALQSLSVAIT